MDGSRDGPGRGGAIARDVARAAVDRRPEVALGDLRLLRIEARDADVVVRVGVVRIDREHPPETPRARRRSPAHQCSMSAIPLVHHPVSDVRPEGEVAPHSILQQKGCLS